MKFTSQLAPGEHSIDVEPGTPFFRPPPNDAGDLFFTADTLLDLLPAAVYVCDRQGRIQSFNKLAAELWGRKPRLNDDNERFCGSSRLYRLDGGPLSHDRCPMAEVLNTGVPVRDQEVVIEREDGERRVALVNIDPIKNAAGLVVGAVNCFSDISGRKRAEQEREEFGEVRQRLAAIVETSEDAIVSKNLDGIILTWNAGAERIFGYTAAEAIGRHITLLIPEDRHYEEDDVLTRLRAGERIEHYETVRRRKDGELLDISLSVSPLRDSRGNIVGASKIARDITERKKAQAQQQLLSRELQHRTRNIFTVVHSLVNRSLDSKCSVTEAKQAVLRRLHSLAQTHEILMENELSGASLAEVVRAETNPYSDRVSIAGPEINVNARAAQNFALALHELATNAAKHGALSNKTGWVDIRWSLYEAGGQRRFNFHWHEKNGPPIDRPKRKGFGTTILNQVMSVHVDSLPVIDFADDGLRYELSGPLERITTIES